MTSKRNQHGYWYSILKTSGSSGEFFVARYKRGIHSPWRWYERGVKHTWNEAYKVLEQHATPAALQLRFTGTY